MMFYILFTIGLGISILVAKIERDWSLVFPGLIASLIGAGFITIFASAIINEEMSKPVLYSTHELVPVSGDSLLSVSGDGDDVDYTWRTKSDDGRVEIVTGSDYDTTVYETDGTPKVEVYHLMTPDWVLPWGSEVWDTTYKIYLNDFDTKPLVKGD